ncbi:MAG: hypothetical protein DMG29_12325 [Acidobacteria bacterium]|nr:MAG: hypothetical protein DMG29_12325 [Acidobacteriota bacterium]
MRRKSSASYRTFWSSPRRSRAAQVGPFPSATDSLQP